MAEGVGSIDEDFSDTRGVREPMGAGVLYAMWTIASTKALILPAISLQSEEISLVTSPVGQQVLLEDTAYYRANVNEGVRSRDMLQEPFNI